MTVVVSRKGMSSNGTIILAHGAGAGSGSDFMQYFQSELSTKGFEVILFDFPYMQKINEDGKRRPPDRANKLVNYYQELLNSLETTGPLIIGGKSMGGRIASMVLAENPKAADGLLLLGYPFHPPGKPEKLRTEHLGDISAPTLIVQGERDTFGGRALVEELDLPDTFQLHWAPDGDHSLKPRKISGLTELENRKAAIKAITAFNWL